MSKIGKKKQELEEKALGKEVMELFGRGKNKNLFVSLDDIMRLSGRGRESAMPIPNTLNGQKKIWILTNSSGEYIYISTALKYQSPELINGLSGKYFDLMGKWLQKNFDAKKTITLKPEDLKKYEADLQLPDQCVGYFLKCFIDCGLIKVGRGKALSLAAKNVELTASKLRNVIVAKNVRDVTSHEEIISGKEDVFATLKRLHTRNDKKMKMPVIQLEVDDSFDIQHLCGIRIGHKNTDHEQLEAIVVDLEARTKAELPHLIVVSDLIQGSFQYDQVERQVTLVDGLDNDGNQLAVAKALLKRISNLGVKVVVNKGDDDKLLAKNITIGMMLDLRKHEMPDSENENELVSHTQMQKMWRSKNRKAIYDFAWRIAIEYMMRTGRELRSAKKIKEISNGSLEMAEANLLFNAYEKLAAGESLPGDYSSILEIDKIPLPGKVFNDFTVADDFILDVRITNRATGKKSQILVAERHYFRLTSTSMINDPAAVLRAIYGQTKNKGDKIPNYIFVEHEAQSLMFSTGSFTIVTLPGMQKMNLDERGQYSGVVSDPPRRIVMTRREVFGSGSTPFKIYPDKSFEVSFFNRHFMEKADISKDRIAIPIFTDWQTGSISASTDLQAIFLDYVFHELLPNHPTYLAWLGDIIEAFNFQAHAIENQLMGLVSADSQKELIERMIISALSGVPKKDLLENLGDTIIVPGNHEWNSGGKWPGVVHCDMIKSGFEIGLAKAGAYDPARPDGKIGPQVKIYDSALDENGNFMKVYAAQKKIGGYGFRFQHMIVEKGAGGAGGLPALRLKNQLSSNDWRGVDIVNVGHWHNPEFYLSGNTLIVESGSLAGPTGFEYLKTLKATTGATVIKVGGNKAVSARFMNAETLANYPPKGFISEKNLNELGFKTDSGFNRLKHGFIPMEGQPQSSLQKYLWSLINKINREPSSIFGR